MYIVTLFQLRWEQIPNFGAKVSERFISKFVNVEFVNEFMQRRLNLSTSAHFCEKKYYHNDGYILQG